MADRKETSVSGANATVASARETGGLAPRRGEKRIFVHTGRVVLPPALITASLFLLAVLAGPGNPVRTVLSMTGFLIIPLPAGIWLGLRWPGVHLKAYAGYGALIGTLNALALIVIVSVDDGIWPSWMESFILVLVVAFTTILLYGTGALLGDWIEKKRRPQISEPVFAEGLARRLANARRADDRMADKPEVTARIKKWSQILKALTPLFGLIGSVIGSFLIYLAAIKANPPPP